MCLFGENVLYVFSQWILSEVNLAITTQILPSALFPSLKYLIFIIFFSTGSLRNRDVLGSSQKLFIGKPKEIFEVSYIIYHHISTVYLCRLL
jgi:hypothetical protein